MYVEKVLDTPIDDGRKLVVGIILSRYLISIKRLEYEKAASVYFKIDPY